MAIKKFTFINKKQLLIYLYIFILKTHSYKLNSQFTYLYLNHSYFITHNDIIFLKKSLTYDFKNSLKLIDLNMINANSITQTNIIMQYNWLLAQYLKQLSYYYLGIKLDWVFVNLKNSLKNNFFKKFWYIIYKKKFFKVFFGKKKKTLSWFLQLYKLKDPQGLINLVQKKLYVTRLKRHKRIFYLVGFFFRMLFLMKKKKDSLKGCSLFFKGKLGKKGSVRKSKFFVKIGNVSLTNKNLRINYKTYIVVTLTGVIGCGISIFY